MRRESLSEEEEVGKEEDEDRLPRAQRRIEFLKISSENEMTTDCRDLERLEEEEKEEWLIRLID